MYGLDTSLPSYIMDVVCFDGTENLPVNGEQGNIYVDTRSKNGDIYAYLEGEYVKISSAPATSCAPPREREIKVLMDDCPGCGARSFIFLDDHTYQCEYCGNKYLFNG